MSVYKMIRQNDCIQSEVDKMTVGTTIVVKNDIGKMTTDKMLKMHIQPARETLDHIL